jgi:hypothetical protein
LQLCLQQPPLRIVLVRAGITPERQLHVLVKIILLRILLCVACCPSFILQGSQQQQGQGRHRLPHHYQVRATAFVFTAGGMFASYQQWLHQHHQVCH